mmetsp:Transcript_33596/g.73434  ORF Transcript_33596/g.73434 Transcript_33596/m.73434 type:complete len:248 (+) Transcript_33596:123-866(+)
MPAVCFGDGLQQARGGLCVLDLASSGPPASGNSRRRSGEAASMGTCAVAGGFVAYGAAAVQSFSPRYFGDHQHRHIWLRVVYFYLRAVQRCFGDTDECQGGCMRHACGHGCVVLHTLYATGDFGAGPAGGVRDRRWPCHGLGIGTLLFLLHLRFQEIVEVVSGGAPHFWAYRYHMCFCWHPSCVVSRFDQVRRDPAHRRSSVEMPLLSRAHFGVRTAWRNSSCRGLCPRTCWLRPTPFSAPCCPICC